MEEENYFDIVCVDEGDDQGKEEESGARMELEAEGEGGGGEGVEEEEDAGSKSSLDLDLFDLDFPEDKSGADTSSDEGKELEQISRVPFLKSRCAVLFQTRPVRPRLQKYMEAEGRPEATGFFEAEATDA